MPSQYPNSTPTPISVAKNGTSEGTYADAYPYRNLCALLLVWDEVDQSAGKELGLLGQVLAKNYGFEVETYRIPSENPHQNVNDKIDAYERRCSRTDSLLLVYYVGHGRLDKYGNFTIFAFNLTPQDLSFGRAAPKLNWGLIQRRLEAMKVDVLIFLNACFSAGSIKAARGGDSESRTELIVASGVPAVAFGDTLTQFVLEELRWRAETLGGEAFTASCLFNGILKRYAGRGHEAYEFGHPSDSSQSEEALEQAKALIVYRNPTPIYFSLNEGQRATSILLKPVDLDFTLSAPTQVVEGTRQNE